MSWTEDASRHLGSAGGLADFVRKLEGGLAGVLDINDLKDALAASSIVLHGAALEGELVLADIGAAARAFDEVKGPATATAVLGLGDIGRAVLEHVLVQCTGTRPPALFAFDVETTRARVMDPRIEQVVLDAATETVAGGGTRLSEMLRNAYRAAAGSSGPPPIVVQGLLGLGVDRVDVHVVVGMEEAWSAVLPHLLMDLRSFLGRGLRGRTYVHIAMRPSPRLKGTYRAALEDVERTHPYDDAFVVCASEGVLAERAAKFIVLSHEAPEVLARRDDSRRGGSFGSHGVAPSPAFEGDVKGYLNRLEEALAEASPTWKPGSAALLELASEQTFLIHPPDSPPPEEAWRLCPELRLVAIAGVEPTICRVVRGLRLADLRLG